MVAKTIHMVNYLLSMLKNCYLWAMAQKTNKNGKRDKKGAKKFKKLRKVEKIKPFLERQTCITRHDPEFLQSLIIL
jgi:hypothetical protein